MDERVVVGGVGDSRGGAAIALPPAIDWLFLIGRNEYNFP